MLGFSLHNQRNSVFFRCKMDISSIGRENDVILETCRRMISCV